MHSASLEHPTPLHLLDFADLSSLQSSAKVAVHSKAAITVATSFLDIIQ
jgi:hypothetical protein